MAKYIAYRVVWTIPVVLVILLVVFLLMHAVPGGPWDAQGPARAMSNLSMDSTTKKNLYRHYGLNEPLWKQFTHYVIGRTDETGTYTCGLICGNLGPSYRQVGRMVQDILFSPPKGKTIFESEFGYTLRLSLYAFLVAAGVGIPMGIAAATRQGTGLDYVIKTFATLFISLPNFVFGLLMIIILGGGLHLIKIAPTNWSDFDLSVWFAPVSILSIGAMAGFTRLTRASVLDVMRKDYIRTARGKGASQRRLVYKHMFKNALIPILTFSGPALLELFAGSFVIESMFGYPGMGREFVNSVTRLDYSMIMAVSLVYALMIAGVNLLVDLLYHAVDPRVQVG